MLAERITDWTREWEQKGLEKGVKLGIEQGIEQGIEKGEQALLRRLLVRRFGALPEWAESRLTGASLAQLEGWGDRLLDAQCLEDVFQ